MGLPMYEEMAEITLNCIVKEFSKKISILLLIRTKPFLGLRIRSKKK
jgi:hypothetical protein